jgi:ankyrin repeat protein
LESSTSLATTGHGYNLLHLAAWNGDTKLARRLIRAKEDASLATSAGWTPLHLAAQNGHLLVVEMLLNVSVEPEPSSSTGFLPLHLAAQNGHAPVVTQLLPLTKDINVACKDGRTPRRLAKANGHSHVVKILQEAMSNLNIPASYVYQSQQQSLLGNVALIRTSSSGSNGPDLSDDSDSAPGSVKYKGHKSHQKTVHEKSQRTLAASLPDRERQKHQRTRDQSDLFEIQPEFESEEKYTTSETSID